LWTLRWRRQSRANPSLKPNSLVTGKNTGNLSRITTRALSSSSDIKDLADEFPSEQAGKFTERLQPIYTPHQGSFSADHGKSSAAQWTTNGGLLVRRRGPQPGASSRKSSAECTQLGNSRRCPSDRQVSWSRAGQMRSLLAASGQVEGNREFAFYRLEWSMFGELTVRADASTGRSFR
jgi:hypothetical protein